MINLEQGIERTRLLIDRPATQVKASLFWTGAKYYLRGIQSGQFDRVHVLNDDVKWFTHVSARQGVDGGDITLVRSRALGNAVATTQIGYSNDEWYGELQHMSFTETLVNLDTDAQEVKHLAVTPRELSGDFPAVAAMQALRAVHHLSQGPAVLL